MSPEEAVDKLYKLNFWWFIPLVGWICFIIDKNKRAKKFDLIISTEKHETLDWKYVPKIHRSNVYVEVNYDQAMREPERSLFKTFLYRCWHDPLVLLFFFIINLTPLFDKHKVKKYWDSAK